jgi:hypothetical protein
MSRTPFGLTPDEDGSLGVWPLIPNEWRGSRCSATDPVGKAIVRSTRAVETFPKRHD